MLIVFHVDVGTLPACGGVIDERDLRWLTWCYRNKVPFSISGRVSEQSVGKKNSVLLMQMKRFSPLRAAVCDRTASLSIKVSGDRFNKHSCLRPRRPDSTTRRQAEYTRIRIRRCVCDTKNISFFSLINSKKNTEYKVHAQTPSAKPDSGPFL